MRRSSRNVEQDRAEVQRAARDSPAWGHYGDNQVRRCTPVRVDEREPQRRFAPWEHVLLSEPPVYGSDYLGTRVHGP